MSFLDLQQAVGRIPAGEWAVGVSGGADSVALLTLLTRRVDLSLHVVHLDHEFRDEASRGDAEFVRRLSATPGLRCTIARRSEIEQELDDPPANIESLGRRCRQLLYQRVVREHGLDGVILAHHADDQAQTILMRLARGSSLWTLRGMAFETRIDGLRILRPLIGIGRARLTEWLGSINQDWREDSSNALMRFARNRARVALSAQPELRNSLIALSTAVSSLCDWIDAAAPPLAEQFCVQSLADLPAILARRAAMRWLVDRGCTPTDLSADVIDRLLTMSRDAATPARADFPGPVTVRRRGGIISAALRRGASPASPGNPRPFPDA